MALMIFSIWLMVDVPGNRAFPSSISPRIQPRLHMSTPLVYLWTRCIPFTVCYSQNSYVTFKKEFCPIFENDILFSPSLVNEQLNRIDVVQIPTTDAHHSWYLADPSRISGALYHRVATYSVSAGFPLSSWIWLSDLAKPKSHSLTTQSVSNSTLDGCGKHRQEKHSSQAQ